MAGAMNARRSAKTARLSGTGREGVVYRPAIFAAMIAALLGAPATAAEPVGVVTILEGDAITIDAGRGELRINVADRVIAGRRAKWKAPAPRYTSGVLAKSIVMEVMHRGTARCRKRV